jgi:hypothetical protein
LSFEFSLPTIGGASPRRAASQSKHLAKLENIRRKHEEYKNILAVNLAPADFSHQNKPPAQAPQTPAKDGRGNPAQAGEAAGENTRAVAPAAVELGGSMTSPASTNYTSPLPARYEASAQQPLSRDMVHPVYSSRDLTLVPAALDAELLRMEQGDYGGAVRPTTIKPGEAWHLGRCKTLLSAPETSTLQAEQLGRERNEAFDLLDLLTK